MSESYLHLFNTVILRYLYKKRLFKKRKMARKINLHFIQKEIYKKVRTKLVYFRNSVIGAQKFVIWAMKLKRLQFRQLTYVWDLYIRQICDQQPANKKKISQLDMGEGRNNRIESVLSKQKEKISKESKDLGVNRKVITQTKVAANKDVKSKFEVMLDFMYNN